MSTETTTLHKALLSAWAQVEQATTPDGGAAPAVLDDEARAAIADALEALALAADLTGSEAGL